MLISNNNLKSILSTFKDNIYTEISAFNTGIFECDIDKYTKMADIPYEFKNGSAVAIDNNIYLLGSSSDSYNKYNYKYDTTTNTYTQMADIPYVFKNGSAVAIGTDIYLLGGTGVANSNYKYDTTNNTYTQMADIPYRFHNGSAVAIGTNIYLLGSSNYYYDDSNVSVHPYAKYNYKYDTTTNTYTQMADVPYELYAGIAVAVGTNIYILGSSCRDDNSTYPYAKCNYKYDTTTNTYTQMADIPYDFSDSSGVAIGTDIYLLGGLNSGNNNYKYDTTTNSYTKLTNIPYTFRFGSVVSASNIIYLLGGYNSLNYNYKYRLPITANCTIKKTNHSIYTQSESYTSTDASIVEIGNEYYTEYNGNNIINNTYPISSTGTTKMYIKSGAILNDKSVTVDTEGWQDINLLDYM